MSSSNQGDAQPMFAWNLDQQFLTDDTMPLGTSDIGWQHTDFGSLYGQPHIITRPVRAPVPVPASRSPDTRLFFRSDLSPLSPSMDSNVDLNLSPFQVPEQYSTVPVAIARFDDENSPWSSNNLRSSHDRVNRIHNSFVDSGGNYQFCPRATSIPDSAYHSQSVPSVAPTQANLGIPSKKTERIYEPHIASLPHGTIPTTHLMVDQRSQTSRQSGRSGKSFDCMSCGEVMRCKSDLKKHTLKHVKVHKCDVPDCKRTKGFATTNDLDRHKKSVHQIGLEDGLFKCTSSSCKNKNKVWPRLDNFKQHIKRMHAKEDEEDLIKRWNCSQQDPVFTFDETLVEQMDTNLAVAGIGTAVENDPLLAVPEPDTLTWNMLDHNSENKLPQERPLVTICNESQTRGTQHIQSSRQGTERPRETRGTASIMAQSNSRSSLSTASQVRKPHEPPRAMQSEVDHVRAVGKHCQNQAVRKSSRNLSPATEGLTAVLHLLSNVKDVSIRDEAAHVIEALQNHIKQEQEKKGQFRSDQEKSCPNCPYVVARNCDLRKHLKRHQKPYGCTYPRCHKRFGAKSDWKRHENSQHFQQEVFRCDCGQFEHQVEAFRAHLATAHKISSRDQIERQVERLKVGASYLGTFWCGFCKEIVSLSAKRNAAWDERFNHIANHFEKQKRRIEEWLCLEENKTKMAQVYNATHPTKSEEQEREEEEDDGDVDAQGEDDDGALMHASAELPPHAPPPPLLLAPPPPPATTFQTHHPQFLVPSTKAMKRTASEASTGSRPRQRRRTEVRRYCCACRDSCSMFQVQCVVCSHELCENCQYRDEIMRNEDLQ